MSYYPLLMIGVRAAILEWCLVLACSVSLVGAEAKELASKGSFDEADEKIVEPKKAGSDHLDGRGWDDEPGVHRPDDPSELGLDEDLGLGLALDLDHLDIMDDLALLAAEDVVVSASRRLQRIEESPSSITVITREQIRASPYNNLVDLMRLVPGADVYRLTKGMGTVGLRSGSYYSGDRMLVLVDGRDVALHLFGLPVWMAMPFDMESIERIEVIRGPGSTLYGANALQGVVNIVTRSPQERPFTTELNTDISGRLTSTMDLRVHGRTGSWGYWGSAGLERRALYGLPDETSLDILRGRLFLDWLGHDTMTARIEAGIVEGTGDVVSPLGDGPVRLFWPYLMGRLSLARTELFLVLDWSKPVVDVDLRLVLPEEWDNALLGNAPPLYFPTRSVELTAHHTLGLFEGSSLMVGGSARAIHHMEGELIVCPDVPPGDFDPTDCAPTDVWETRFGLFLQNEWYLRENLLLNLGCRLDHNSLTADLGLSPRAALVYSHSPGHAWRLGFGRAYRKPTFTETHLAFSLQLEPGTAPDLGNRLQQIFGNIGRPDLVNEYVDSVELGFRGRLLDERLFVTVDTFAARFQHAISHHLRDIRVGTGFGGIPTIPATAEVDFANSDDAMYSYGGEMKMAGKPLAWVELSGSYALDRLHVPVVDPESGDLSYRLNRDWEPHHRLIGSVRLGGDRVRLGADAMWMSKYITRTRNPESALEDDIVSEVGGTTLVSGTLSYRANLSRDRELDVGIAAINVLNQPYREVGALEVDGRASGGGEIVGPRARFFVRGRL